MSHTRISKPMPGVLLLEFKTQVALCRTFCRVQEHYESPEFQGKIFTLGEYRAWYEVRYGGWTYDTDWSGFNVPASAFQAFRDGLFDPLTPEEAWLMGLVDASEAEYVIASFDGAAADTIPHEISHAMFRLLPDYREAVLKEMAKYDLSPLKKYLEDMGYHESVWDDECNAYLSASKDDLLKDNVPFPGNLARALWNLKVIRLEDFVGGVYAL